MAFDKVIYHQKDRSARFLERMLFLSDPALECNFFYKIIHTQVHNVVEKASQKMTSMSVSVMVDLHRLLLYIKNPIWVMASFSTRQYLGPSCELELQVITPIRSAS